MNNIPLWENIVIALIGSGLFGGIVSIILSPIAARQQIKQLEMTYHQKLNDNFIQNAQKYIDTLYTPLYKSLSKLAYAYEIFRTQLGILGVMDYADSDVKEKMEHSDPEWASMMQAINHSEHETLISFVDVCREHEKLMKDISANGLGVYLLSDFEERLVSFTSFLDLSVGLVEMGIFTEKQKSESLAVSPLISSSKFEKRFRRDIKFLKNHIKEISFGTAAIKK